MKKNIIIIVLSILILGLGAYVVYDKFIDKDNKNTYNTADINENSEKANNKEQSVEYNKEQGVEDIYGLINKIKTDNSLSKNQKLEKILAIVYDEYYKITGESSNYTCSEEHCINNHNGSTVNLDESMNIMIVNGFGAVKITKDDVDYDAATPLSLEEYLNYNRFNAYSYILKKELGIDTINSIYDPKFYSKINDESFNICIDYEDSLEYFYININDVNTSKAGWYYLDKETGKCSNTVKLLAQYKINKTSKEYTIKEY